jgi:ATP-dependent RNA helicase RhlE
MTFKDLKIIDPILRAIEGEGYEVPSPIQIEAIPLLLERKDLLASAQTGTGKTAAFAIPIIQQIVKAKESNTDQDKRIIRALILAPTRELAEQIKTSFQTYSGKLNIKTGVIYGGVGQRAQENMIRGGIDILIATPGRLMDLMQQKIVRINTVEHFVLDEADMLLDMGFIKDVKYIKGFIPKTRQTMMFSATISKEISALAADLLVDPQHLDMAPPEKMIDKISHSVFFIEKKEKFDLLLDLLTDKKLESVLVFMKTKHTANKLVEQLQEYGVGVDAIHGSKSQRARQTALDDFKNKRIRVLVATDIAARGIDIDELSHVINYDLPISPETYVHRIGRTGRRGLTGETFTFCSRTERSLLRAVESHTGLKLKVLKLDPVSPDSKFKKIVEGKTSDSEFTKDISAKTNNDYKESNRGSRDNKDFNRGENRFKPKKNEQGEIIENAPANFGKQKRTTRKKYKNYENNVSTSFDEVKTKPNNKPSISSEPSGFIKEDPTMKANKEPRREYFPRSNKPHFEKNEGERKDNNQQSNYAKRDRSFTKKEPNERSSYQNRTNSNEHGEYAKRDRTSHREDTRFENKPSRSNSYRGSSSRPDYANRSHSSSGQNEGRIFSYGDNKPKRDYEKRDRTPHKDSENLGNKPTHSHSYRNSSTSSNYADRSNTHRGQNEGRPFTYGDSKPKRDYEKRDHTSHNEGKANNTKRFSKKTNYGKSNDNGPTLGLNNNKKTNSSRSYQGKPKRKTSF